MTRSFINRMVGNGVNKTWSQGHGPLCLGSFTCITQHTGPTALRPIRRTKQLWLSVLLKDTSAATGQAGIRTHILATPELESNALDGSATTLREIIWEVICYCCLLTSFFECTLYIIVLNKHYDNIKVQFVWWHKSLVKTFLFMNYSSAWYPASLCWF